MPVCFSVVYNNIVQKKCGIPVVVVLMPSVH